MRWPESRPSRVSARQGAGSLARMPSPSGWQAQHDADYRAHWHALAARADPDALTWLVLGDSAAVGIGAESVERTYVAQVAERVAAETGRPVRVVNLAVSGAMAKDVLADQLPLMPASGVDAVTCVVGGNDVTWAWRFREAAFEEPLEAIARALPAGATLGLVPTFRIPPFEARVRRANTVVRRVAARHGLGVADVHAATWRRNLRHQVSRLARDLFHPNGAGYEDWAAAVAPEVLRQVRGQAPAA